MKLKINLIDQELYNFNYNYEMKYIYIYESILRRATTGIRRPSNREIHYWHDSWLSKMHVTGTVADFTEIRVRKDTPYIVHCYDNVTFAHYPLFSFILYMNEEEYSFAIKSTKI